ncbi:MAG TPA: peptide-methionine (R)-S-oxide reductase, partial [Polyangiaceae bacterium]|nr:peptide-methionine (R)-S-oxide reductase [Polyangiaceae bacterium]
MARGLTSAALGLALCAGCNRGDAPASSADAEQREPAMVTSGQIAERAYAKPPEAELEQRLTPLQYDVTQHEGTEAPFHNQFWDNHEPGLYVDVVTGEPLFSSTDKF